MLSQLTMLCFLLSFFSLLAHNINHIMTFQCLSIDFELILTLFFFVYLIKCLKKKIEDEERRLRAMFVVCDGTTSV